MYISIYISYCGKYYISFFLESQINPRTNMQYKLVVYFQCCGQAPSQNSPSVNENICKLWDMIIDLYLCTIPQCLYSLRKPRHYTYTFYILLSAFVYNLVADYFHIWNGWWSLLLASVWSGSIVEGQRSWWKIHTLYMVNSGLVQLHM